MRLIIIFSHANIRSKPLNIDRFIRYILHFTTKSTTILKAAFLNTVKH